MKRIPAVVHQIWLGEDTPVPPKQFREASHSWSATHPEWEVRLWSRVEVEKLLREARPDLLELFRGYRHWVERADAARYLILHEFGGVYADHDVVSAAPLDGLLNEGLVLAPTRPAGVSNDFIMAAPGHPVLKAVLDELPNAADRTSGRWVPPYARVIYGTGPGLLTRVWRKTDPRETARLLSAAEYGHGAAGEALVRHIHGSSWHEWDGRLVALVWRFRWAVAVVLALLVAILLFNASR